MPRVFILAPQVKPSGSDAAAAYTVGRSSAFAGSGSSRVGLTVGRWSIVAVCRPRETRGRALTHGTRWARMPAREDCIVACCTSAVCTLSTPALLPRRKSPTARAHGQRLSFEDGCDSCTNGTSGLAGTERKGMRSARCRVDRARAPMRIAESLSCNTRFCSCRGRSHSAPSPLSQLLDCAPLPSDSASARTSPAALALLVQGCAAAPPPTSTEHTIRPVTDTDRHQCGTQKHAMCSLSKLGACAQKTALRIAAKSHPNRLACSDSAPTASRQERRSDDARLPRVALGLRRRCAPIVFRPFVHQVL